MNSFFAELKRRNVIRIALFYGAGAWLLLQVADVLLGIVDAPQGSLRLLAIALALGFPFALVLAWAFEITPEGIKRERDVATDNPGSAEAARKLNIATIVVLLLAMALLSWDMLGTRATQPRMAATAPSAAASTEPRDLSIAVLPFVNMSRDPENEYFSEGLSEEVLNVLARIDDFRVAGRTSSFAFKDQNQDLRDIGERLSVANILEGSVRRQDDRVRVTAQLIDARTGYHLWSDTYDRQLDDIFAIQDDIATEVVRALRFTLLPGDEEVIRQTAKGDVEAYNLFLRGQFHARLRTPEGLRRALEEFQQAVLVDPDYAPPYAGIAMVYALLDNYNYRSLEETRQLADKSLERALEIDPNSDDAWAVKGLLLTQGPNARQNNDEARAALERAAQINPNNAFAHLWLIGTLLPDREAARSALQRAYAVDPLSPVIVYRQVMWAVSSGDQAQIDRYLGELREVAPEWFMTWAAIGLADFQQGRLAEAAVALAHARTLNPEHRATITAEARTLEMLGYEARAEQLLTDAFEQTDSPELQLALAGLRTRRAIEADGLSAGLAVYREEARRMQASNVQELREAVIAELAFLEIAAGEPKAAEQRFRTLIDISPEETPSCDSPPELNVCIGLLLAINNQDRPQAAAEMAVRVQALIDRMRGLGINLSRMALLENYLQHMQNESEAESPEAAAARDIEQGWRESLPQLRWTLTRNADDATVERIVAMMADVLEAERARYDLIRAEPPGDLR